MAYIYEIDGVRPVIAESSFIHPNAVIIGDVTIGENCYIGPLCSLRGDFGRIVVGSGANIQDNCVLHCFPGRRCTIDDNGHISQAVSDHDCIADQHSIEVRYVLIEQRVFDDLGGPMPPCFG